MKIEEIKAKIYMCLNAKFYDGQTASGIVKDLGFIEGTGDAKKTYALLKTLRNDDNEKITFFKVGNKRIHYLLGNEEDARLKWDIKSIDLTTKREIKNITCGFVLIEKGVITQKKGGLASFDGVYPLIENSSNTNVLDSLVGVEDNTDLLCFIVENRNMNPIEKIKATIELPRIFFEIGDFVIQKNCKCDKERYTIFVDVEPLMYKQKGILAIQLLPTKHNVNFKNKKVEKKYKIEECVPNVKSWYKKVPMVVKGNKVTFNFSTKGHYITIEEDEILIFDFKY